MTKQHCKYNASLVATTQAPVLQLNDDPAPRKTKEITLTEMMTALKAIADKEIDDLDAPPSGVPDEAAKRASGFLTGLATIDSFIEAGSQTVGNKWEQSELIYVHPVDKNAAICVAKEPTAPPTFWQLSVRADLSAAQNP